MEPPARQLRIVLVRPRNPGNLLAAARAAANFGFDDLVVVAPYQPVWDEARSSRGAATWLRRARLASALPDAIADRNWVLGTSSLARRQIPEPARVISLDLLPALAARAKNRNRVAILFGSEKHGLDNHDLSLCHAILRIPTLQQTPSMNLGQAVAVCCYQLRAWTRSPRHVPPAARGLAAAGEINRLVEEIGKVLGSRSESSPGKWPPRQTRLRQMLMRWPLTSQDVSLALGLLRDLAWQLRQHR